MAGIVKVVNIISKKIRAICPDFFSLPYIPSIVQSILAKGCWSDLDAYGMVTINKNLSGG
jgi:hypothetical protein